MQRVPDSVPSPAPAPGPAPGQTALKKEEAGAGSSLGPRPTLAPATHVGAGARPPPRSSVREGRREPAQDWTAQLSGRPLPTGHWAFHSGSLDGLGARSGPAR